MKRVWVYEHFSATAQNDDAGLLAAGLSMRDAVVADLLAAGDYRVSVAGDVPGASQTPPATAMPAQPLEGAYERVAREAAEHDAAWVIAPETGGVLAGCERAVGAARWIGCSSEAIAIATSKSATLRQLAAHGIATPLAFDAAGDAKRWVVKPDDGAGALATRLHTRFDAAWMDRAQRAQTGTPAVMEPWVDGTPLSLSLICGTGCRDLLAINAQHISVAADGTICFHAVEHGAIRLDDPRAAELRALAARIHEAIPGLCGFVGIDFVWHAQRGPVVIEVNPRVTSAYVGLSADLGRNLAAECIAAQASRVEAIADA